MNSLVNKKTDEYSQYSSQNMKYSDDYDIENRIKIETVDSVKKEIDLNFDGELGDQRAGRKKKEKQTPPHAAAEIEATVCVYETELDEMITLTPGNIVRATSLQLKMESDLEEAFRHLNEIAIMAVSTEFDDVFDESVQNYISLGVQSLDIQNSAEGLIQVEQFCVGTIVPINAESTFTLASVVCVINHNMKSDISSFLERLNEVSRLGHIELQAKLAAMTPEQRAQYDAEEDAKLEEMEVDRRAQWEEEEQKIYDDQIQAFIEEQKEQEKIHDDEIFAILKAEEEEDRLKAIKHAV
ncbi:unnamed protein product [Trichogramma brassicae]|uniref:Uncharacterized protein n=1 Tax=Trichogramma brassicae TaxID=86971 RepID=A0A6H5INR7_9HYME|nr:unnamed protein product [Trichogramma brassicae]